MLSVIRVKTLDEAIELVNRSPFGNATSIFTRMASAAREYSSRIEVGMVGVNIGVAAPMAFFPFAGLEEFLLRRSARARQRRGVLLHRAESADDEVVLGVMTGGLRPQKKNDVDVPAQRARGSRRVH